MKPSLIRSMKNSIVHCLRTFQTVHRYSTSGGTGHSSIYYLFMFPANVQEYFNRQSILQEKSPRKAVKVSLEDFINHYMLSDTGRFVYFESLSDILSHTCDRNNS